MPRLPLYFPFIYSFLQLVRENYNRKGEKTHLIDKLVGQGIQEKEIKKKNHLVPWIM